MKYRLTEAAHQDIVEITRHIRLEQKSPQNAKLVAQRLKVAFGKLAATPSLGHVRDELQDEHVRVLPVTGVLILYDGTLCPLTILRAVHAARDLGVVQPRVTRTRRP